MSAWRIEIRTGFYHRAKKTRPIKGLKLNPAVWRWWVLLAQCKTLGETQSKTGTTRRSCPLYLLAACHGAPLQSQCYLKMRNAHFTGESGFAPTELVSNNLYTLRHDKFSTLCRFGRGVPRP